MIGVILLLLLGFSLSDVTAVTDHLTVNIVVDGDSNTNAIYQGDSTWCDQLSYYDVFRGRFPAYFNFVNVGSSGKMVYTMVQEAATAIDPYYDPDSFNICILGYGGGNDAANYGGPADSIYSLVEQFCTERRAVGWYTIVVASQSHTVMVLETTDSVMANWATFADDIALVALDPNIGYTADTGNTTYWHDVGHLSIFGLGIYADSVYGHVADYIFGSGML